jgi:hypothetical protein
MVTPVRLVSLITKPLTTVVVALYQEMLSPIYKLMNLKERLCLLLGVMSGLNVATRPWKLVWLVLSVVLLRKSLQRHWNPETYQAHVKPPLKKGVLGLLDHLM